MTLVLPWGVGAQTVWFPSFFKKKYTHYLSGKKAFIIYLSWVLIELNAISVYIYIYDVVYREINLYWRLRC